MSNQLHSGITTELKDRRFAVDQSSFNGRKLNFLMRAKLLQNPEFHSAHSKHNDQNQAEVEQHQPNPTVKRTNFCLKTGLWNFEGFWPDVRGEPSGFRSTSAENDQPEDKPQSTSSNLQEADTEHVQMLGLPPVMP